MGHSTYCIIFWLGGLLESIWPPGCSLATPGVGDCIDDGQYGIDDYDDHGKDSYGYIEGN